ncbi:hypothetical protein UA24_19725 [Marinomonas sp. BSi20414]|nr:hypothetical protein [Marinomonas sp. BSi20414]
MPAVAGEFAYVVAGELDDNVVAEALIPTLYSACGDGVTLDKTLSNLSANISGSDKKWFAPAKKAALSRQIALRLSCPTSDVVYVQKRGARQIKSV